MKSLKSFVERFEKKSENRHLWLENEKILAERIIVYNDLGSEEQYIVKKDKGFGDSSRVIEINGRGGVTSDFPVIKSIFFRSQESMNFNQQEYFIKFNLNHAVDKGEIMSRMNLENNVVSLNMSIFRENGENQTNPKKLFEIFKIHYGVFGSQVIPKDIHHNRPFINVSKDFLKPFVNMNEDYYQNSKEFYINTSGDNLPGFTHNIFMGHYKRDNLHENYNKPQNINSKLIFPDLKKRDISNPYQGMDLFFDI